METSEKRPVFTLEEATDFFAEFYRGDYHIPSKIRPCGSGWEIRHYGTVATFDFDELTRLVLMGHEKCIRVEITPYNFREIKVRIHKRVREGRFEIRHPTIEQAIEKFRPKANIVQEKEVDQ